ncbi:MAG: hypothetical protein ACYSYV_08680 [Planctomycetota bacterium]
MSSVSVTDEKGIRIMPWGRFYLAVRSLAGPGALPERLHEAFKNHILPLRREEFPEEMQDEFQWLYERLKQQSHLSDDELVECAHEIVRIYDKITRSHDRDDRVHRTPE